MNKDKIGELIKFRRSDLLLSQQDLAEMAGLSSRTIYMLEQGKGNISLDNLQKVADILGWEIMVQLKKLDE